MSNGKNTLAPENKKPRNSFLNILGKLKHFGTKPQPFKDLPEKESELKNFIQRFNEKGIILKISESNQTQIDKETEKLSTANDEQQQQIKEKIYLLKVNSFLTLPISVKLRWAMAINLESPKSMTESEKPRQKRLLSDQIIDLLVEKKVKGIEEGEHNQIKKNQKVIDTFYKIHEKLINKDKFLGTDYMAKFIAEQLSEQLSKQSEPFFNRLFKGEEITDEQIDDFVKQFSINAEKEILGHSKTFQAILFSEENMQYLRRLRATEKIEFEQMKKAGDYNKGDKFTSSNDALFEYYKKVYSSNKGTESKGGQRRGSDQSTQYRVETPGLRRPRSNSAPPLPEGSLPKRPLPKRPDPVILPPLQLQDTSREATTLDSETPQQTQSSSAPPPPLPSLNELIAQSMEQSEPRSQSAKVAATETTQLHRPRSSSAPSRQISVEKPNYHDKLKTTPPEEGAMAKPELKNLPPKKQNKNNTGQNKNNTGQGRGL
jgi:hypothetical protein